MTYLKTLAPTALVAFAVFYGDPSYSAESRLFCDKSDNLDAKMSARYVHTPTRALFDVSFKAPNSMGLEAREVLEVRVDGYVVGYVTLSVRDGGIIGASLSFDSHANSGYSVDATISPFPASWPGSLPPQSTGIGAGSRVMIGSLGCTLQQ